MATPKGMRQFDIQLQTQPGKKVHLYSQAGKDIIIVQLRIEVPTEQDVLAPSFKVSAPLNRQEARVMGYELLRFAGLQNS